MTIIYLAYLLLLFSLFPSLPLQLTIAKPKSKIKQYESIFYSNALKPTIFFVKSTISVF